MNQSQSPTPTMIDFPGVGSPPPPPRNGERIDRIEAAVNDLNTRLAVVETKLENMATTEALTKLENKILTRMNVLLVTFIGGVIAIMGTVLYATFNAITRILAALPALLASSPQP